MSRPYLIWDWNGTLLDDVDAAVNALNRMLAARSLPLTDRTFYRAHFNFPVRPFYSLLGMDPDHDWEAICEDFHAFIAAEPQHLRADTRAALARARAGGLGQSILSALRQDLLLRDTAREGVRAFFEEIYGVDNLDGASKRARGYELLEVLKPRLADRPLYFLGDTLHDAEVGTALGATVILVAGGHQSAERLAASGCFVAPSLVAAVDEILARH